MSSNEENVSANNRDTPSEQDIGEAILDSLRKTFEKSMTSDNSRTSYPLTLPVVHDDVTVFCPTTEKSVQSGLGTQGCD